MRSREQIEAERAMHMGMENRQGQHPEWLVDLLVEIALDLREQNERIIALLESRPCGEKHVGSTGTHVCDRPFGHRGMHSGTNATESLGWNG